MSANFHHAVTPVNDNLIPEDSFKYEEKLTVGQKIFDFLLSQLSLRNIFLLLLAIFLIAIAFAVWGLSYTGSSLAVNFLMSKLRTSAANSVAQSLINLFNSAEHLTQQVQEYSWADKNELKNSNLTETDKLNYVHFLYSALKPNLKVANSINFIRADGSILAVTYAPGTSVSGWRTTQSFKDTGSFRAALTVTDADKTFNLTSPQFSPFLNYAAIIPSYSIVANSYTRPEFPSEGMMFNVSLDTTGSGNILTSNIRPLVSRIDGSLIGVTSVVFYVSTLKELLVAANPSLQGFIAVMQDDMTLVADSINGSVIKGVTPCATNSSEILQLCSLIKGVGGVTAFQAGNEYFMQSPINGQMRIITQKVRRGGLNWNIFVALPDNEYYGSVVQFSLNTIYVCIGLILVSLIFSGVVTFIVLRTLNQISVCFTQVQQLNLDSKVILNTVKSKSLIYEVRSLRNNFKSMLATLKSFQKFIPRELVKQLVASNEEVRLGLQRRVCTVFFMDIAGFTSISEILEPENLVDIMSTIFGECSKIIVEHRGNIDKYIGDCIMAQWGAPQECAHQEAWAVLASVKIQRYIESYASKLEEDGYPNISVRIGLNTGQVLVGYFGSNERLSYTCMGDPVNLASRLESLNKYYNTSILISSSTYDGFMKSLQETQLQFECPLFSGDIDPNSIPCRRVEQVKVKGKNISNLIYEVMPFEYEDMYTELEMYEQGYDLFLAGRFNDALQLFNTILRNQKTPNDVVLKKIEMCEQFIREPPEEWDGSIKMDEK